MNLNVVILAAGKGSRMKSNKPKVLQPLAGKPLITHVFEAANRLSNSIHIVVGHEAEQVKSAVVHPSIHWINQSEQLGTGHAVLQTLPFLSKDITLILYGDVPLIRSETLSALIEKVTDKNMALLMVRLDNPKGYGRLVRNANNQVTAIVEEKDASVEQKQIKEVNTGIMAIKTASLKSLLPQITPNNAQKEYYLTDLIVLSVANDIGIECVNVDNEYEVQGVNDKKQLADLERIFQKKTATALMEEGVTIIDPDRIDIRGNLSIGRDVSIDINCIFQGEVTLGNNVTIGPNCIIGEMGTAVRIGNDVEIKSHSIIEEAVIADNCVIGPFARLRPGTVMGNNAKIGNFVETKKADIGEGSKVNHLTYIGDAIIGKDVNIGAGTITCNYDGVNKFKTTIEDNVFIGSNTSLVAPVTICEGSTIGAGSTINKNVNQKELAIARAKQVNIQGWQRPKKK